VIAGRRPQVPLVAHVVYHFGTGGLENGLVNIINRTPRDRYRHALVCLTDAGPFISRIERDDVALVELHRPPGHDFRLYGHLWSVLRGLRPSIVHTRNLAAVEGQVPAALLPGVKRVHGEHGRDVFDLAGANPKYNLLRRVVRPLVQRYTAVSQDLAQWLRDTIGVDPSRIRQIYNGVDAAAFSPRGGERPSLAPPGLLSGETLIIGTVGRLAAVKDQRTLLEAFARVVANEPGRRETLRLVIVGDGSLRSDLERESQRLGIAPLVWFAGDRQDVADLLRLFDVFVLPSLAEGISNTVLEAMSSGLPVVATRVGGNPELVDDGETGTLVPPGRPDLLASALGELIDDPQRRRLFGARGRDEVTRRFDWDRCVAQYLLVYDELLGRVSVPGPRGSPG